MQLQTIRRALGQLQSDPEQPDAWKQLDEALDGGGEDVDESLRLMTAARQEHLRHREWEAVAKLLGSEARLALGSPREVDRLRQEARVLRENLLEEGAACRLFERILELDPQDHEAAAALEESRGKRDTWQQLVDTYLAEAEKAPDDLYRSSMSMRAAEVELRFASEQLDRRRVMERLTRALQLDGQNERAAEILELMYRRDGNYDAVVEVLGSLFEGGENLMTRIAAGVRAARVCRYRLTDAERTASFYRKVLELSPTHPEALSFISEYYSAAERWDDLVHVYEASLASGEQNSRERLGDVLQVAMLLWKKRGDVVGAEAWFERLRKLDPANQGMLDYFRERFSSEDDAPRLLQVLSGAQRLMPSGPEKQALTAEIARLAAGHQDPKKAIEQYKNLLRQDPSNEQALQALKQLYRMTQSHHALVELLRQQLEATPTNRREDRLEILGEVAELYRGELSSDTALVSVLNQMAHLSPDEPDIVRELVALYEKLGRWRDLLTSQQRLATLTTDREEKLELMRAAGRRWLDQFSNVQNATAVFEALLEVEPSDREARDRLRELYKKRRAWSSLFRLYESELADASAEQRLSLLQEMARLASERLGKGDEATRIYQQILESDPNNLEALSALERQAERSKEWDVLARALERRAELADSVPQKMAVLQKLGSVYSDHLGDSVSATRTFLRVLELSPGHARALRVLRDGYLKAKDYDGLEKLYASQGDWEGLADVLSNAADRVEDGEEKVQLSYRAAEVYAERLQQPERTFRCYERILAVDPTDLRAAKALLPIYEKEEKWARLPALYELCLEAEEDPAVKSDLLQRLIKLTATRLVDRGRALTYARAAFELDPESPATLAQLEDASRAARDWEPFVGAVSLQLGLGAAGAGAEVGGGSEEAGEAGAGAGKKRRKRRRRRKEGSPAPADGGAAAAPVSSSSPPAAPELSAAATRALEMKLAVVFDEHLGRPDDAAALLTGLVERDPTDADATAVLERWLRRDGKRDELRKLWDIKLEQQAEREDRISLLSEWADLEQNEFGAAARAADLYRRILQVQPGRLSAVRALPRLLLSLERPAEAAEAIEAQREHVEGSARADLEVELSGLYLGPLERPEAALRAVRRALEIAPEDPRAMDALRRLVEIPETRREAAGVLAESYARSSDARREAEALESALEAVAEADERKALLLRLADVHERKLESYGAAFDIILRTIRENSDDLALWDRAEDLAAACGRVTELAHLLRDTLREELSEEVDRELCDRAARLYEETLGDPVAAVPYLERLLSANPADQDAFLRLKQILTSAERWGELEDLYNRATRAIEDIPTRVDLLTEVALVCEEIIEDDAKAIAYYERTLEIQPNHDTSMRSLDRLYQRTGAHGQLAALLETRLSMLEGDEVLDTELRLARVQLEELHEPGKAIEHVERVLSERPSDYGARELAESVLEIGSFRARAARALEAVYESRDEIRELVKVLEIRWESTDDATAGEAERGQLLRRIATLKDDRLHDDAGALEAFARYVPTHGFDEEARERFVEIGLRRGEFARVAAVLEETAGAADVPSAQGEILMQAANIYAESLADIERAESIYRRVLELDPSEPELTLPAARALEALYAAGEQHAQLAEMIRVQIRLELDLAVRAGLLGRLGELSEKRLRDSYAAIDAYRRRLEDLPDDAAALEALDRLYEATEQWRELVSVLEHRRLITLDSEARRDLMRRQARVLSERLSDATEATEVWRTYRGEFGDGEEVLGALEALYREAERWEDLADTLEAHLAHSEDSDAKLRMLTQLGDLRGERLGLPQAALDAYREALAVDFSYRPARLALERLLESSEALTQREAAEVLEPVFEADADHQRLLKVLEIQAEAEQDPVKKLSLLQKCADTAENSLSNPERTLTYVTRAVREGAGHVDLAGWLQRLERVAQTTKRRADQVALLREVVVEIFEGDVQFEVTQRIAELARDELKDRELAREYYEKALELRLDAVAPMRALEAIYEQTGDMQSLLAILERRADAAESQSERVELMLRRADLLVERTSDPEGATEVYERVFDLTPNERAIAALERLYAQAQRWEDLIELHNRRLESKTADHTALRVRVAQVAARELSDLPRAFDALEAALEADRHSEPVIAELEYLMESAPEAEYRARAAALLEPIYLSLGRYDRVMATLACRLEYSQDPEERRDFLSRLAKLHEEQQEDYAAALSTLSRLLQEDITSEDTISELERLARVSDAAPQLAAIYAEALERITVDEPATAKLSQRAGQLFSAAGQLESSQRFYRRALAFDPDDREVFDELDELLARAGEHQQRVDLYASALDTRYEDSERILLYHQTAQLQRGPLGQPDAAVESYRRALDIDPQDTTSLDALSELYRDLERWSELAELCLGRADQSTDLAEAAHHRLALARLRANELGDIEGAIDQLEEIVQANPSHSEAIDELEVLRKGGQSRERIVSVLLPLYEAADDWRRLIKLNEDRFALADTSGEKVAVLRETAGLWERRGHDEKRARRGLAVAFELDPDDAEVRADYERLVAATGAWDELAGVYQQRLKGELASRHEVLTTLASVHDEKRNDPRRALAAYQALVDLDETNVDALEKLEQLATMLSDWSVLVRALRIKTELVDEPEDRASLWRRVGETRRDMLEQPDLAVEAYERAAELEPDNTFTLDNLIELYRERQDTDRLVELYQRRVDLSDEEDAELKYELLCAAGDLCEARQNNNAGALDMFNQALSLKPSDPVVLERVNRLYAAEEMWPELLENLRFCVTVAEEDAEKANLRCRIAGVLSEQLGEYDEALETYREVLEVAPADERALKAVSEIGQAHPESRELAATILVPALTALDRHEELVAALEMRLTSQGDPLQRSQTLERMAAVLESRLDSPERAQAALLRALTERPDSPELHAEIDRLSRLCGGFERYAAALSERAQATFDTDLAMYLYCRLGEVAERELQDAPRAIRAYEEAILQAGDQPELLAALDRLYQSVEDYETLSEILERRALVAEGEIEQSELYFRMATIQREQFQDRSRCLYSLRRALEFNPQHAGAIEQLEELLGDAEFFEEVAEVLEGVYRESGNNDKLAGLFERRVGLAGSPEQRLEARRTLARVLEDEVGDLAGAQRIVQQGLAEVPGDLSILDELGRLASLTADWTGAATALEAALQDIVGTEPATGREVALTLASWRRQQLSDNTGAERALSIALECGQDSEDILLQLEELQKEPGREQSLVETLRRRARLAAGGEREELYRRAKQIADGLAVPGLQEGVLRDFMRVEPESDWALGSLAELRFEEGDFAEALDLIERRIEVGICDDLMSLRHRAASIAHEKLHNEAKAIELYSTILQDEPGDAKAAFALRTLLAASQRWEELRVLLTSQIDIAEGVELRQSLRLELARLDIDHFGSIDAAVEQLQATLEEQPGQAEAVLLLNRLYEREGKHQERAVLLQQQVDFAEERADVESALELLVRLAELSESELSDTERALDAYRRILVHDATNQDAVDALVRLLVAEGRLPEAADVLESVVEAGLPAERVAAVGTRLADLYEELGDKERCCAALERVMRSGNGHGAVVERLQKSYEALERWSELAELLAVRAESAHPVEAKVKLLTRAAELRWKKLDEVEEAAILLQRATDLAPDDRPVLLQLCDVLNAAGRSREAVEALQRIVQSYGGRRSRELGEIHRRLAHAYRSQGERQQALKELDHAFKIEPGNVGILQELGSLALELGELKKAQQMYRALLLQRLDKKSPITKAEVFYNLGRVHGALGEGPKAKQMLERAVQTDPGLQEAKDLLATMQ